MSIRLAIDDTLINEACVLGHFKNQEEAVINALRKFIDRRKQQMTLQKSSRVIFGEMEDKFSMPTSFDDSLPKDIEDNFYSLPPVTNCHATNCRVTICHIVIFPYSVKIPPP